MSHPVWRKSSHSDTQGNACVEVSHLPAGVGVRDSKAPDAGHLSLSPGTFAALLARIKRGDLSA